jgi:biofilm PGA synthesis N-glycosyltransferase PgaC
VFKLFLSSVALIAYTLAGYPLIVAVWARLRPRPVAADSSFTPSVSLIIAAYNEADCIRQKLDNCSSLDYPDDRLEIIVVTDGSDDGTDRIASPHPDPRVRVLHRPERLGKTAALNRAVSHASGGILVFSDANNLYRPETIRALAAPFSDSTVGAVTGRKTIGGSETDLDRTEGMYWRYEAKIVFWEGQIGSATGVAGEVLAVRRDAFVPPPEDIINDDTMIALSAASDGWRIAYAPTAVSIETASATVADEMVRRSRIFAGTYQALSRLLPTLVRSQPRLAWQLVSHKGLRLSIPFAMATALASNLALARRAQWIGLLALAQTLFYGAAVWGWRRERSGRPAGFTHFPYYFCQANVAALRGFAAFAGRRAHRPWAKARRGSFGARLERFDDRD